MRPFLRLATLRDEHLIYQQARITCRLNNSVFADWLRARTPRMVDPKVIHLPTLACGWMEGATPQVRFVAIEVIDYKMISLTADALMEVCMAALTVRNLPEETHRALRLRAAQHGRSTEAEVRMILEEAVRPEGRTKIGSALAAFGQRMGGVDLNVARDESPPRAASFE